MPITVTAPAIVAFTDTTPGATSWAWQFGDGDTSTLQNPTHLYAVVGVFTVRLEVNSTDGMSVRTDTVTVGASSSAYTAPSGLPTDIQGSDPQVMLRCSNDGGKTWGPEVWRSAGKIGEYSRRVGWNRLGCARRRVFEVVMTDPIQWRITGAYVQSFVAGSKEA